MADLNPNTPAGTNGVPGAVSADMNAAKAAAFAKPEVIDGSALMAEEEPAAEGLEGEIAGTEEEVSETPEKDSEVAAEESTDEHTAYAEDAFKDAADGTTFKDAEGRIYEKVEGVELPVPRCDPEAEIYKELKNFGFDQDIINREFWIGKGDVSDDTKAALKEVFPPGLVDEFFASKKAEHLAYLDSLSRTHSEAEVAKREAIAKIEKRDTETLGITASVFGVDDGGAKWPEVVDFINSNYEADRRKEIATSLSTGTAFTRKALLSAIKRDMDYAGGDVHKLINADGDVSVGKVGGGALTGAQYHDILSNPRNPDHKKYATEPAFAAEIDARRQKGINNGL